MPDAEIESVLFDIDGTLITTGGAGAVAWRRAFEDLHGQPVDIREVTEAGMVDTDVATTAFRSLLGRDPESRELTALIGHYLKHLPQAVDESDGYRVMPGIEELLNRLVDEGRILGLTTGNVAAAAHIKLARARLNRYFAFGGYGSDATDRITLTKRAVECGEVVSGGRLSTASVISIGDTPRDVEAGHGAGIRVIGVATGNFSLDQLRDSGADWTLPTVEQGFPV